jgi:hypothetical protein
LIFDGGKKGENARIRQDYARSQKLFSNQNFQIFYLSEVNWPVWKRASEGKAKIKRENARSNSMSFSGD